MVGGTDGWRVGLVGAMVGVLVGKVLGRLVGNEVGILLGDRLGAAVGAEGRNKRTQHEGKCGDPRRSRARK